MLGKRILSGITTIALCVSIMLPANTFAAASFTGGSNVSGAPNTTISITDLQVTGAAGGDTVPVFLYVPNGSLSMTTTTGLTFTGSSSGQRLYFSGTLTDVNTALATLKYTHSSTGTFTLEASIIEAGQIYDPSSQHIYEVVNNGSAISATAARTAATSRSINGVSGYLANITSSDENSFVAARISQDGWFGASDAGTEGDWVWLDGPESGTLFWRGTASGTAFGYENWAGGEPNQSGDEDCSQFYANGSGWNDLPCSSTLNYYVVEYGAPGNLPSVATDSLTITVASDSTPPTITNVTSDKADGYYKAGEVIDIDVTFSEAVTSTGSVTVTLETGDTDRTCTFTVSSATTGTCNYTVQAGDTSSDLTISSISGTIADGASNAMSNFVPSTNLAANKAIVIDTTAPIITNVSSGRPNTTYATISWTTNEVSSSRVEYGATADYGSMNTLDASYVTSHSSSITSLSEVTKYYFRVISADQAGNSSTSEQNYFTTQTQTTRTGSVGGGGQPGCANPDAINYDPKAIHDNLFCKFKADTTEPTIAIDIVEENKNSPEKILEKNEEKIINIFTLKSAEKTACIVNSYTTESIRFGKSNNPEQVKLLEQFLNKHENAGLEVNGIYEKKDFEAVIRWQEKYADDILKPWGLTKGTGYVYTRSLAKIKALEEASCPTKKEDSAQADGILNKEGDTK